MFASASCHSVPERDDTSEFPLKRGIFFFSSFFWDPSGDPDPEQRVCTVGSRVECFHDASVTGPSAEAKRGGHNTFMIGINDTHRWRHLLLSHAVWGFDA
jgi:hypothetical protein